MLDTDPKDNMFYLKLEVFINSPSFFQQEVYILGDLNTDILAKKSVLKSAMENFFKNACYETTNNQTNQDY